MLERSIQKKVCDYAKSLGWLVFPFKSPSNVGVPDRMFIKAGECFFIEFKKFGKKPTELQKRVHKKLEAQGFQTFVVDNVLDGKAIFN
jgi:hypothetical protein